MHAAKSESSIESAHGAFAGIDAELVRSKPLVAAIAREITETYGGNEVLNWLEAEILLEDALNDLQ